MKIRQGFVSNSSSSSFVLIIEKEWYEQCLEELDEYSQHVVGQAAYPEEEELFGVPIVSIAGWYNASGDGYLDEIDEHESEMELLEAGESGEVCDKRYGALDKFETLVKKEPGKFYINSMEL